ncbi:hypothetical protein [Clostridium sp. HV4-5-A1G]|uniref:hypothetical protein n=1 Tax=Clostridium sp. HV4-5-A1G TaxID=2004595 RepID=UPI00123BD855|nr:hypothetical protein [Clostridium sp. HV4-5-A1G]KAA8676168.1 hypothetical protein F3O63_03585 [Clostridium sp. HV4-5-A1G]
MTEYTLKQMLDKFERNHSLKFKYVNEMGLDYGNIHLSGDGHIVNEVGTPILSNFTLSSKFRLVNEPVSAKEAFKAFEEGKTIYCILLDKKYEYSSEISGLLESKTRHGFMGISVEEILYGKWFIREEN